MKRQDIKVGQTYHFVATDSPERQHLVGQPFTVVDLQPVWRRLKRGRKKVYRALGDNGVWARPEELEPLPENNCSDCLVGEMVQEGMTRPSGLTDYKCNNCGRVETFP